jgi:hypothetical protein
MLLPYYLYIKLSIIFEVGIIHIFHIMSFIIFACTANKALF